MIVPKIGLPWKYRPILVLFLCFELIKQRWLNIYVHYYLHCFNFHVYNIKIKIMIQFYNDSAYSLFAIVVNVWQQGCGSTYLPIFYLYLPMYNLNWLWFMFNMIY